MLSNDPYFERISPARQVPAFQQALARCIDRLYATLLIIGARNPKIGTASLSWEYCQPGDWVSGFQSGQYWLALQLTGDPVFLNAARCRQHGFRRLLDHGALLDHDLGFQYSLTCVADWKSTGSRDALELAVRAAEHLLNLYRPVGEYIQAWVSNGDQARAAFVEGRIIADTMQNVALLFWAADETCNGHFAEIALKHCRTTIRYLLRRDGTSFHTWRFDPSTGKPLGGETHQGWDDDSCWSRGQAWLIHGFAQSYASTGDSDLLTAARKAAAAVEQLLEGDVPRWDYTAPPDAGDYKDSSAGAITAAGLYILAHCCPTNESQRWFDLADRLLLGLIRECDLTTTRGALGLLDHGAPHVTAGCSRAMLPYGDYYFIEALMRALGHQHFFW